MEEEEELSQDLANFLTNFQKFLSHCCFSLTVFLLQDDFKLKYKYKYMM